MSQEKQTSQKNDWLMHLVDAFSKIVSIISAIALVSIAYIGLLYNSRAVADQKIKDLIASFASEWKEKEKQVFSAYTHLRSLVADGKLSKDNKNVQRLLAENMFKAVVNGIYPDRDIPKDGNAFRRIKIIDNLIGSEKSTGIVFTEILFIKENEKAVIEFENFIRKYPNHSLIPWAHYNLASIYCQEGQIKMVRKHAKSFVNKALYFEYNDGDIEEMRRRIMCSQ